MARFMDLNIFLHNRPVVVLPKRKQSAKHFLPGAGAPLRFFSKLGLPVFFRRLSCVKRINWRKGQLNYWKGWVVNVITRKMLKRCDKNFSQHALLKKKIMKKKKKKKKKKNKKNKNKKKKNKKKKKKKKKEKRKRRRSIAKRRRKRKPKRKITCDGKAIKIRHCIGILECVRNKWSPIGVGWMLLRPCPDLIQN